MYHDETHFKNVNEALLDAGHAVIDNYHNEFNPYDWTLYVIYPPPEDPPQEDPPSENPPNDDDTDTSGSNKNRVDPDILIPISIGFTLIAFSTITVLYVYHDKIIQYIKPKIQSLKKRDITPEKKNVSKNAKLSGIKPIKRVSEPSNIAKQFIIKDITPGMHHISLCGKIDKINKIHEFTKKDGSKGCVGSFEMSDTSGRIRVVLWEDICSILKRPEFTLSGNVKIINGYSKVNIFYGRREIEIHLGKYSRIEIEDKTGI